MGISITNKPNSSSDLWATDETVVKTGRTQQAGNTTNLQKTQAKNPIK